VTARGSLALSLIRLARPRQWAKSGFVLLGPAYHLSEPGQEISQLIVPTLLAFVVFSFASSSCYVVNDILDREADRTHPRKRSRPIACGAVSPRQAWIFAFCLIGLAGLTLLAFDPEVRVPVGLAAGAYIVNVWVYSFWIKHIVIADVVGLSIGFLLRVVGGCLAVGIWPSTWLLNCTFFLAMLLAFGKRLGERRTLGSDAAAARAVQSGYSDDFLRMAVVVTAVGALLTYAGYTNSRAEWFEPEMMNLTWLTVLPATFGLLRCIVLLERGAFDDPTELAFRDRAMQVAVAVFVAMTIGIVWFHRGGPIG
jgi:decaprenyl-phosphate phosphoribosyltransferase